VALLDAAAELIVESGVGSLTLARVGERAGYSRGIVTHRFGSKRALIEALAEASQSGLVAPSVHEPGLDRLLHLLDGYLSALGNAGTMSRAFLLLWTESTTNDELAGPFRERDRQFREALQNDVAAGIAAGTIRPTIDARDVAVAIVGQLRGVALQRLLDPDQVQLATLRDLVVEQWRRTLQTGDGAG
jgi:AcrR family transcriptional regulator